MKLLLQGHDYRYAVEQILLIFFHRERPEYVDRLPKDEDHARCRLSRGQRYVTASVRLRHRGRDHYGRCRAELRALTDPQEQSRVEQQLLRRAFFQAARSATGETPPWGSLTGVRPVKLAVKLLEQHSEAETLRILKERYSVTEARLDLCMTAAKAGLAAKNRLSPRDVSLYVGIPFCPTRCTYCSFISHSVEQSLKLVEPYLDVLEREIRRASEEAMKAGLTIRSVYFGGGTPTTLSAPQLDRLLSLLEQCFDLSGLWEYTVEAGRPDTITADKLRVLRDHRVGRISINPQSMDDRVLQAMGRHHSARAVLEAYDLARSIGGFSINMDLIAGLPEDSPEGFSRSLEQVIGLRPENLTVHTLALKKGAHLSTEGGTFPGAEPVAEMLEAGNGALGSAGYLPYYLYRQKFMSGNFENVGWCLPGHEGLYNIYIMEEFHSILSLGGGAVTKLVQPTTGRILRCPNPKYPFEYIRREDDVMESTAQISAFYQNYF